jgi:hypothetical protein
MRYFASIEPTTGVVSGIAGVSNPNLYTDGETRDGKILKAIPPGASPDHYLANLYWNGSEFIEYPEKPDDYHDWNGSAWVFNSEFALLKLRRQRTSLLFASDWTQMPDSPLTETERADWATYRQSLRDMTDNFELITQWSDIVFPAEPS